MDSMNKARFMVGLVVFVISMIILFAYAIPNVQRAHEIQRLAQIEYDQSQAELEQSYNELNTAIDEIVNEESIH